MEEPEKLKQTGVSLGLGHTIYIGEKLSFPGLVDVIKSINVLDLFCLVFALYLVRKCKSKRIIQIILAILFSPCYIVYRLIKPCS